MTMEPLLRVDDIQTYLGDSHILQGVSLEAQAGEVVAVRHDQLVPAAQDQRPLAGRARRPA